MNDAKIEDLEKMLCAGPPLLRDESFSKQVRARVLRPVRRRLSVMSTAWIVGLSICIGTSWALLDADSMVQVVSGFEGTSIAASPLWASLAFAFLIGLCVWLTVSVTSQD